MLSGSAWSAVRGDGTCREAPRAPTCCGLQAYWVGFACVMTYFVGEKCASSRPSHRLMSGTSGRRSAGRSPQRSGSAASRLDPNWRPGARRSYNYYTTGHWNVHQPVVRGTPPKAQLLKSRVNAAIQGEPFTARSGARTAAAAAAAAGRGGAAAAVVVDEDEEDDIEDDPFEGLSPAEIEAIIAREAPEGDAFAGMSPGPWPPARPRAAGPASLQLSRCDCPRCRCRSGDYRVRRARSGGAGDDQADESCV